MLMHGSLKGIVSLSPLVLATALPDGGASQILYWVLGLAGTAVAFNQIAQAARTIRGNAAQVSGESEARKRSDCIGITTAIKQRINGVEADARLADEKQAAKIDEVKDLIHASFLTLEKNAEARAAELHNRIHPLATAISANTRSLQDHLDDHRAEGKH